MNAFFRALLPYVPVLLIVLLLARRLRRPRELRPAWLWVLPGIFAFLALWYAWMAYRFGPALTIYDDLTILAAAVGGALMGVIRASLIKLELKDGKIQAALTMWGLGFLLVWLFGRTLLRELGHAGAATPYGLFTAALLAFATTSNCVRSVILAKRSRALLSPPVASGTDV